jgi:hypothetical protein
MSNNITAFVLGLRSAYEGEQMIFGLLSLINFAISFETLFFSSLSSICCCQLLTGWKLISFLPLLSKSYQFF